MIIAIHQPNYLPYLGFFDKMKKSDIFVIYDDAQFNKEDFQHRNRIRIYQGWKWLTVPVEKKCIAINEIRIKNEVATWKGIKWADSHFKDIRDNYKNTPYYKNYETELERIYKHKFDMLIDLNMSLIHFLMKVFQIDVEIVYSSDLIKSGKVNPGTRSSERLFEIVKALEGNVYLSGHGGNDYLDESQFEKEGIKVEFQDYRLPVYKQYYDGFIPNMSAIDSIFNIGDLPE